MINKTELSTAEKKSCYINLFYTVSAYFAGKETNWHKKKSDFRFLGII